MAHITTPRFWAACEKLPARIRKLADRRYQLLKSNPEHHILHFKRVTDQLWSVRVGEGYRALGVEFSEGIAWFWIRAHDEYERLIGL